MNSLLLAVLLLGSEPHIPPAELPIQVDFILLNHYYDADNGKIVFDQYILMDWKPRKGRFQVEGWMLKLKATGEMQRLYGVRPPVYQLAVCGGRLKIHARQYEETWSDTDIELIDRNYWPKEKRRFYNFNFANDSQSSMSILRSILGPDFPR